MQIYHKRVGSCQYKTGTAFHQKENVAGFKKEAVFNGYAVTDQKGL